MKGGAREQLWDIAQKYAQPLHIYLGIFLVLGITYVGQIPDHYTYQANSLLGRTFLFFITTFVADTYSWVYGVLMALFVVLLLVVSPRTQGREGFQSGTGSSAGNGGGDLDVKLVSQKKRWWSEEVLQENPIGIEEEKVKTSAIQDAGSSSSNSVTSSR
jgi:hypothetical protein